MRVGIVGGGITGLTSAYRLSQKNIETILFEKEAVIGGRINYAAVIASEKFQRNVMKLAKELELEEIKVPLRKKEVGFVLEKIVGAEKLPLFALKTLGVKGTVSFLRFSRFVNSLNFDAFSPSPKLLELRKISFEEFSKDYPENLVSLLTSLVRIFSVRDDMKKIAADYGLNLIRMGLEIVSGKGIGFEEVNLGTICNVLVKKIEEKGGTILTSSEVREVKRSGESFEVSYERLGEEKRELVDKIVFTLPLFSLAKIFPELKLVTNVEYNRMKVLIIEGEPKHKRRTLFGFPGNPYNLRVWLNLIPTEQYFFPWAEEKEVNLDFFYQNYRIISEKILFPALPVLSPNPQVPELKTEIEGVYLAGDFYYYPFDTPVQTAEKVADLIEKE